MPAERIAALRTAFDEAMKDPALLADAKKARLEIAPTSGIALQSVVDGMIKTNAEVLARIKAVIEESNAAGSDAKGGKGK